MAQAKSKKISPVLVILIASVLQGCGDMQPLCPPPGGQASPQKISNEPTIAPYKVAGAFAPQPNIADVKEALKAAIDKRIGKIHIHNGSSACRKIRCG